MSQFYQKNSLFQLIYHALHGFLRQMELFLTDMSNRVEHQNQPKRQQSDGRLGSFWCSTRLLADTETVSNLRPAMVLVKRRVL